MLGLETEKNKSQNHQFKHLSKHGQGLHIGNVKVKGQQGTVPDRLQCFRPTVKTVGIKPPLLTAVNHDLLHREVCPNANNSHC